MSTILFILAYISAGLLSAFVFMYYKHSQGYVRDEDDLMVLSIIIALFWPVFWASYFPVIFFFKLFNAMNEFARNSAQKKR